MPLHVVQKRRARLLNSEQGTACEAISGGKARIARGESTNATGADLLPVPAKNAKPNNLAVPDVHLRSTTIAP